MKNHLKLYLSLIVGLILLIIPAFVKAPYILHIFIIAFYIVIASLAWNILGGLAGQFSLGHAAFMALGGYTCAILLMNFNVTPWIGMIIGALVAGLIAALVFYPCFVLKGPYFTLATIALGETFRNIFTNWQYVGKAQGILLPYTGTSWYLMEFTDKANYYYIGLFLLVMTFIIVLKLDNSRLGFAFKTIRENEDTANAIGINVVKYKLIATFISAALTAVAGGFYAQYIRFIDPEVMLGSYSVEMVLPSIIGGLGTVVGPIIGGFVLVPLSEYLRSSVGNALPGAHLIIYSVILIAVIRIKPEGIMGWINQVSQIKHKAEEKNVGGGTDVEAGKSL